MSKLTPKSSAKLISNLAKHVTVSKPGIHRVASMVEKSFINKEYSIKAWKRHKLNPKTMDKAAIDWIFLVDTLNFSFWSSQESSKCRVHFEGEYYTGYWALCAAVNKAVEKGIPICDPKYYASITLERLKDILHPDQGDDMPFIEERWRVLNETGTILLQKYQGSFVNVISKSEGSAEKLLDTITTNFPSYKDEALYKGHRVCFYKRAQILIGDIWACCEGEGLGYFNDIDIITVFADYRIPQFLLHMGALKYSEELMEDLMNEKELPNGSEKEVEIRGCTIWAAQMILEELQTKMKHKVAFNSILIDYYMWDYRNSHAKETDHVPFHRTRCIYY